MIKYAWANGHDKTLAQLTNIGLDLQPHTPDNSRPHPASPPLDRYPIRTPLLSGSEHVEGNMSHFLFWQTTYPEVLRYMLTTYFTADHKPVAMTINLRLIEGWYRPYNCLVARPQEEVDFQYASGLITNLRLRLIKVFDIT